MSTGQNAEDSGLEASPSGPVKRVKREPGWSNPAGIAMLSVAVFFALQLCWFMLQMRIGMINPVDGLSGLAMSVYYLFLLMAAFPFLAILMPIGAAFFFPRAHRVLRPVGIWFGPAVFLCFGLLLFNWPFLPLG